MGSRSALAATVVTRRNPRDDLNWTAVVMPSPGDGLFVAAEATVDGAKRDVMVHIPDSAVDSLLRSLRGAARARRK